MTTYRNYGMEVAQPSNYTRHGEGNFLVQHWGKSFTFTKNGRTWYTIYNPSKRYRINQSLYLNDTSANDNDKTINSGYSTISLDFIQFRYSATATVGDRYLVLTVIGTDGVSSSDFYLWPEITASTARDFILTPNGAKFQAYSSNQNVIPIGFDFYRKFNSAIRIKDAGNVDTNDDISIYTRGWAYSKKLKDYEFNDCTDFAIEYQAASDLTGTGYGWFLNVLPLP